MKMEFKESVPPLEESSSRVIKDSLFPTSPAPTVRETIFSEILTSVLGADPTVDSVEEFREKIAEDGPFETQEDIDTAWKIFSSTYTTTGERGARGKKAKQYMIPFHPSIPKCIKPEETRNWGKWYTMLMTSVDREFNSDLHKRFVGRLEQQSPSNIFEQVFVKVAKENTRDTEGIDEPEPIRPYVGDVSKAFQKDLEAWLRDEHDSPSNWLQSARDLFSLHFMVYYIQLAVNLRLEFQHLSENPEGFYSPEIKDTHFGLWNESARQDRKFSQEYRQRDGYGIERDIYDSWGRLVALSVISKTVQKSEYDDGRKAYTLSEAVQLPDQIQQSCVEAIENHFPEEKRQLEANIVTSARRLTMAVRKNYEQRSASNQTPITAGLNVIRQLGDGKERKYWRTQTGVGPTLRLNQAALRFLARLFILAEDDMHYDMFIQYLEKRGIYLDSESQGVALDELEEMGMIDRQSDSGGAVYVRTI
jgi:DNA phosphorothioation-dependent restriction protein DptG